ncbi:MAG TPA: ATP-binding protein [Acidimicrobiales bacterium]|nr:ATP-binding protein [Acidimicrobiales bacterium]
MIGLAVVALGLAVTLLVVLLRQRQVAARLRVVVERLEAGAATRGGMAATAGALERVVSNVLLRDREVGAAERRLASALGVIPQGVLVYAGDGEVAFTNEVAESYLTSRHGEALVEDAIAELVAEVVGSDDDAAAPTRTVDLFGPPRRTVLVHAARIRAEDGPPGAVVVIEDVTDRRRLEAVRRDFVANISHELKTPVGALGLLAETLLAEDDPEVSRRLAERMQSEAFRVARTIDDLLALSQIEADEAGLRDEVPVHLFVAEAVDRVRPAAEQQGITIEVVEPDPRLAVVGDRRQLVSAIYNLLDNAVKYSDAGSSVQVRARTDGRWIDLSVADRGIGIPRRDLERVFERFYRVDRARSRETGGTGLGLAIVRHVASNHAGEVRVESLEGEGSTFTLRLPVGAGPVAVTTEAG